ncbi:hypothetical protein [Deinococcus psychrotolerans]|uniref:hypothetical protein n=1 Tax=Deinococcus psychrotolerans TaxID=2489213 RepID=UPI003B968838
MLFYGVSCGALLVQGQNLTALAFADCGGLAVDGLLRAAFAWPPSPLRLQV